MSTSRGGPEPAGQNTVNGIIVDGATDLIDFLAEVYVADAEQILHRAVARGAVVITEASAFYGGYDIARFLDPWHNIWWLFSPALDVGAASQEWDEGTWETSSEPDPVYTTLLEAMRTLSDPSTSRH